MMARSRSADSTLTVSNNLTLFPTTVLNFALGTNTGDRFRRQQSGLGGTVNVTDAAGFTSGTLHSADLREDFERRLPALGFGSGGLQIQPEHQHSRPGRISSCFNLLLAPTNLVAWRRIC